MIFAIQVLTWKLFSTLTPLCTHLVFGMEHGRQKLEDGKESSTVDEDRIGLPALVEWQSTRLLLRSRRAGG